MKSQYDQDMEEINRRDGWIVFLVTVGLVSMSIATWILCYAFAMDLLDFLLP